MSYPNGVAGTLGYAGSGDLTGISYTKGATPVDSVGYGYDSVGFINSVNRAGAELLIPSISNAAHDAANRMTEFNGKPLTYDKSGNVLDMGMQLNVWNQKGQLIHVTGARGGTVSYKYDALGRRVEKDVGGVITRYVYDGINLIAETDAAGTEKAWYVHGGLDRPLVRIASDGSVHYYHADILGSVIALTDSSGTVTTTYRYSPFGETVVEGTDIAQPFRFTGREWDAETGLYYYRARYYSPEMKRFITEDPIRFAAGDVNFYAYVGNNPVNFIDPMGLEVSGNNSSLEVPSEFKLCFTKCLKKNYGSSYKWGMAGSALSIGTTVATEGATRSSEKLSKVASKAATREAVKTLETDYSKFGKAFPRQIQWHKANLHDLRADKWLKLGKAFSRANQASTAVTVGCTAFVATASIYCSSYCISLGGF